MSAWALAIAFCSELIALIASSTDAPPDRTGGTAIPPSAYPIATIRMLAMFRIMAAVDL